MARITLADVLQRKAPRKLFASLQNKTFPFSRADKKRHLGRSVRCCKQPLYVRAALIFIIIRQRFGAARTDGVVRLFLFASPPSVNGAAEWRDACVRLPTRFANVICTSSSFSPPPLLL